MAEMNLLQNRNRLIDVENRLVVPRGGGRGIDWEFGVGRGKLLHLEWINNKVLMYSTETCSQYPMIKHNGKEEYMCVYNWVNLVYCRDSHHTVLINQL